MQLQPVSTPYAAFPRHSPATYNNPLQSFSDGSKRDLVSGGPARLSATLETEFYAKQTLDIEFTSADGDKVSLSMESVQYQKATLSIDASGSPEDMQKIIDFMDKQYKSMREALVKAFIEANGGTFDSPDAAKKLDKTQEIEIPEYWNAENTSQRIVDFAVQFLEAFKGSGEEFLNLIKGAIEEGFKQARDLLGELPDQVNTLVSDTYDLVMQKLDIWAETQGILLGRTEEAEA